MYELTASEASTILSVLSRRSSFDGTELDLRGAPASTFYATRRRIYDAHWLSDRYVPNPWPVGLGAVEFILATSGPVERGRLERELATSPQTVVLWVGVNLLFAVRFCREAPESPREDCASISVVPGAGSIPVYFDYSRAWSRFVGIEGETGYPRALGRSVPADDRTRGAALATALAETPSEATAGPRTHLWHSPTAVTRGLQRLLDKELVQSRSLLNVGGLPPFENRTLGESVFLLGELRQEVSPSEVLSTLHNECNVSPILLAENGTEMLIVALGQLVADADRRTRAPRAKGHVVQTLSAALKHLRMAVERNDGVHVSVDHAYGRLLSALPTERRHAGAAE